MWPTEKHVPLFKHTMLQFYKVIPFDLFSLYYHNTEVIIQRCHDLHVQVMRSIALGLDLNEDYFDYKIDKQCHNLRLLSYPAVKRELVQGDGKARAGAHSGARSQSLDYMYLYSYKLRNRLWYIDLAISRLCKPFCQSCVKAYVLISLRLAVLKCRIPTPKNTTLRHLLYVHLAFDCII